MSLFISGVRLTNFMPFRGEQEVELGPGTYAVVARHEQDERRSNWVGKSSFLGAIWFALTGDHPKRTEDEWITDGEPEGGVDLELSDGTFISRTRKRGASTKLRVVVQEPLQGKTGTERELLGDAAQQHIYKCVLGMGRDECSATWWCAQEEVAWFLKEDPAVVTRTVADWCGLDRLRAARDDVVKRGGKLAKDREGHLAASRSFGEQARSMEQYLYALCSVQDFAGLGAHAHQLEADIAADEATSGMNEQRLSRKLAIIRLRETESARQMLLEEYKQMPLAMGPSAEELELAQQAETAARLDFADKEREYRSKERLACGQFDGVCPVGGIDCPVADKLNADREGNAKLLRAALEALGKAEFAFRLAFDRHHEMKQADKQARAQQQARENVERRLDELDKTIKQMEKESKAESVEEVGPADEYLAERLERCRRKLEDIKQRLVVATSHDRAADEQSKLAAELEPEVVAHREAAQVFIAAERAAAERLLENVAAGSNELLADSGIDLSLDLSWERPIKGLADSCQACGEPFPASVKVALCPACGAHRGQKVERKFRATVRPFSIGARALAGLGTRVAAFGWLKGARGSAWGVFCADEPLAAVDQANGHGIARQLPRLLGSRYDAEQAFVTAHNRGILDTMPKRLIITATERGSRVEVVGEP